MRLASWIPTATVLLFSALRIDAAIQTDPPTLPDFGDTPAQTAKYFADVTAYRQAFAAQPSIQSLESKWSAGLASSFAALRADIPYVPAIFTGNSIPSDSAVYLTKGAPPPWISVLPPELQEEVKAAQTAFAKGLKSIELEDLGVWPGEKQKDSKPKVDTTVATATVISTAVKSEKTSRNAAATSTPAHIKAAAAAMGFLGAAVAIL